MDEGEGVYMPSSAIDSRKSSAPNVAEIELKNSQFHDKKEKRLKENKK
jgi:hypothetical protein